MNSATVLMNDLPKIEKITPISGRDNACLQELKATLKKYGKLKRFGVTLLHRHFDLLDDEILVETCDYSSRKLTVTPIKSSIVNLEQYVETGWRLDTGEALQRCNQDYYHVEN